MREEAVLEQGLVAIQSCLDRIPFLKIREVLTTPSLLGRRPDCIVRVEAPTGQHSLVIEAKSNGQPRVARQAIVQLKEYCSAIPNPYPVFLAPYITVSTGRLCEEEGVGYIDLAGNSRLSFGQVYIELEGKENPFSETRELRSLYSPKSERIIRVLLTRPREPWKVEALANEAGISLGLVSKVKRILEQREWVATQSPGIQLRDPGTALAEWTREYRYTRNRTTNYYSFVSGIELEERVAAAAQAMGNRIALTGFSAAMRYAPSVRSQRSMVFFQGDPAEAAERLKLKPVPSGANLTLIQPYDDGVFYRAELRDGIPLVCPVQAYLDVMNQSGRGEEAGEAILREVIRPSW